MHKSSMTIDLGDPRVRKMLGVESPNSTGRREVVQLAGDAPDPTGVTSDLGLLSTHRLTGGKQEVVVVFGDLLLTADVYALPGEPMKIHLICPRCHKMLTIAGDQKRIQYEPGPPNPARQRIAEVAGVAADRVRELHSYDHVRVQRGHDEAMYLVSRANFGRLSIETFECTWEITDDPHVAGAVHTGGSLCRLRIVIDDNRAREV